MNQLKFDPSKSQAANNSNNNELKPSDLPKDIVNELTQAKNEALGDVAEERFMKMQHQMLELGDRLKQCKIALNTLQYEGSTLEEKIQAIDLLIFHVEDAYVANDFVKIGGMSYIIDVLKEHPFISAIPIVTTASIENPFIQDELRTLGAVSLFYDYFNLTCKGIVDFDQHRKEELQYRATSALVSMLCTNNQIYFELVEKLKFLECDMVFQILDLDSNLSHEKLRPKLLFLLDCILTHHEHLPEERRKISIKDHLVEPFNQKWVPFLLNVVKRTWESHPDYAKSMIDLLALIAAINQEVRCLTPASCKSILSDILSLCVSIQKSTKLNSDDKEDLKEAASDLVNAYALSQYTKG